MANQSQPLDPHAALIRPSPLAPRPSIEVAAGLVFRNGTLLLTQRPAGGHLAGLWEFPGGKREPHETFEECLHRELREELGIEVEVRGLFESITHDYPERTVHLRFFRCLWLQHEPQPLGCPAFVWAGREDLANYQFPAADTRLLDKLRHASELWAAQSSIASALRRVVRRRS